MWKINHLLKAVCSIGWTARDTQQIHELFSQKLNLKKLLLNSRRGGIKPRQGRGPNHEPDINWANGIKQYY